MKKLLLAILVGLSPSVVLARSGSRDVPRDGEGRSISHPLYGGFEQTRKLTTGELVVCSGRCVLAGLIMNTGPITSSVRIRNSSVANGAGVLVIKHKYTVANTEPGNNPIRLPILLDKGITVELMAASTEEEVTVLYLDLD